MPGILFQELPHDVLMLIFDHLDFGSAISLALCRSLKVASDAYLRQHHDLGLWCDTTVSPEWIKYHNKAGRYGQDEIVNQLACSRLAAQSIRKAHAWIQSQVAGPVHVSAISRQAQSNLKQAIRFKPDMYQTLVSPETRRDLYISRWVLFILLMCENLEKIHIESQDELGWSRTAQHLEYKQWPHTHLTSIHINWSNYDHYRRHDLQDIWLLILAPSLKSIVLYNLRQDNNLYTGTADRAAIRTVYWPIELETFSLYHYFYLQQRNSPEEQFPTLPTTPPLTHEFTHLETVQLQNFMAPESWLPLLLCCFRSLRHLYLSASHGQPCLPTDFRLLKSALHRLSTTLRVLNISVYIYGFESEWKKAAARGRLSLGFLDQMQHLISLKLPWFMWFPHNASEANFHTLWGATEVKLAPKLTELDICVCEVAHVKRIAELIIAALPLQTSQDLEVVALEIYGDCDAKEVGCSHLETDKISVEFSKYNSDWSYVYLRIQNQEDLLSC